MSAKTGATAGQMVAAARREQRIIGGLERWAAALVPPDYRIVSVDDLKLAVDAMCPHGRYDAATKRLMDLIGESETTG